MQHVVTCRLVPAILLCVLLPSSSLAWQAPATYQDKNAAHWVGQLSHPEKRTRRLAAYALGRIAPQNADAVTALVKGVVDDDLDVCRYSIYALGRIGPMAGSAAPRLARVIERETDNFYRRGAVRALGNIEAGDARSRSVLTAALKDKDLVLRVDAALALLKLDQSKLRTNSAAVQTLDDAISGSDAQARYQATAGLAQLGSAAKALGGALLRALRSDDADVRRSAARAIGAIGYGAIAPLTRMLDDPNPRTRASVVAALGWCGEVTHRRVLSDSATPVEKITAANSAIRDVAVPALVGLLSDADESVRRAAAAALARMNSLALPALVQSLRADDPRVRQGAGRALDTLTPALQKSAADAPAMQEIKTAVLPDVVAAIAHDDVETRYQAVRLFVILAYDRKSVAETDAEPRLRERLKDPDSRVRGYASGALRQLQSKPKD